VLRTLDAAAARRAAAVSFTGGEPLLYPDKLVRYIRYACELGIPFVRTGTNGFFLRNGQRPDFEERTDRLAAQLAEAGLRNLWISLDSADPATHEAMRGLPGVVEGIGRALPIFERHGLYPTANLGINRRVGGGWLTLTPDASPAERAAFAHDCREAFRAFYRKVLELGFTIVNCCYPMSVESEPASGLSAVYRASSADDIVSFRTDEKALLFQAMSDVVAEFRHRLRIFSPRSMLHALVRQYRDPDPGSAGEDGYACRGGLDFFFVSAADGEAYPCGFRSDESLGKLWELGSPRHAPEASCTRCDWECFRDPSNLAGPLLELGAKPLALLRRVRRDRAWVRLWREDLRYQQACDYCDGRRPPDLGRLAPFAPNPVQGGTI
jgi:MoaA/NifB/PqqE/SkfB family radical SAM enzyme